MKTKEDYILDINNRFMGDSKELLIKQLELFYKKDVIIEKNTGMMVNIADNPLDCVANGTGAVLEDLEHLKNVLVPARIMH